MKDISFIILNYNDAATTVKLVDSLLLWRKDGNRLHYIIVDNCSKDDSFTRLYTQYKQTSGVDVIESEKNGGYSYGNNYGAKYAIEKYHSDYIAIANPDIEIEEDVFSKLVESFEYDEKLAACSPIMKNISGSFSVYSQKLPTYWDDLKACFHSTTSKTILRDGFKYLDQDQNMILTEMLPGCFFVIRADVFLEIGMLDENVFLFCEERILGRKVKNLGWRMIFRSDLFFIHAHSVSIKKAYSTLKTWKILLQSHYYYEKKYNSCNIFQLILLKMCMKSFLFGLNVKMRAYSLKKVVQRCLKYNCSDKSY